MCLAGDDVVFRKWDETGQKTCPDPLLLTKCKNLKNCL